MRETLCREYSISIRYTPSHLFSLVLYDADRLRDTKKGTKTHNQGHSLLAPTTGAFVD